MLKAISSFAGGYQWKWLIPPSIRGAIRKCIPGVSDQELVLVGRQVFEATGGTVISGPFAGMPYIGESTGSAFGPKLLGTYEMEIAAKIMAAFAADYDLMIDIGAAEGYYAVGMAYRCPKLRIVAFEQSESARSLLQLLAELNDVRNRLKITGRSTHAELEASLGAARHPLVICDIDGGELELLDPDAVPQLIRADILVELHDCFRPGLSEKISKRFSASHSIESIRSRPRRWWDCPIAERLGRRRASIAVQEHRPGPQSWFWMKANTRG